MLRRWLPFIGGIGGHTTRSWLDYEGAVGRDVFRFTFMRDPIARYMSHFNYQRIRMGLDWRIEEFLAESRFDNYHTRRYAGRASLERAKRMHDRLVGVPPSDTVLDDMALLISGGDPEAGRQPARVTRRDPQASWLAGAVALLPYPWSRWREVPA